MDILILLSLLLVVIAGDKNNEERKRREMNLVAKRVYCYDCKKLVRCRVEKDKENKIIYATCCRCNKRLQEQGVVAWKYLKDKKLEVFSEPILSPMMITELAKVVKKKKVKKES